MIDVNELNQWISTDEGKAWAEALKAPLLAKRDELLASLRDANGKAAEALRAKADSEKLLSEERQAVEKVVVDGELARLLKSARVIDAVIPTVVSELRESHGLTLKANGLERTAIGKTKGADGIERELDLAGVVREWSKSDAAKAVTLIAPSSGGGSAGPGPMTSPTSYTREEISKMNPREVAAKLDDPAFRGALENLNTGA